MFRERLKQARNRSGLTQDQIAKLLDIAKSTYAGYETGNSEPDMSRIEKLMNILDVDANFLWQDEMKTISPNFSLEEIELIDAYRALDEAGKAFIDHATRFALRISSDPIAGKSLGRAEEQRPRGSDIIPASQAQEIDQTDAESPR